MCRSYRRADRVAMARRALLADALGGRATRRDDEKDVWAAEEAAHCRCLYALLPGRKEKSGL